MSEGWCPGCGPTDNYDEDGCCNVCGRDCNGDGADAALAALRAHEKVRWCACGRPWVPATGLYGTTEQTECSACVLQKMLKRMEKERAEWVKAVQWATEQLDLDGQLVEARTSVHLLRAQLRVDRRRALRLGADRREWKRVAMNRKRKLESVHESARRYYARAAKWERACRAACKHAAEWRAEAVAYMVTGAKDWGVEHARATCAEAELARVRAERDEAQRLVVRVANVGVAGLESGELGDLYRWRANGEKPTPCGERFDHATDVCGECRCYEQCLVAERLAKEQPK